MGDTNIWSMFANYNKKYFGGKLDKVRLSWSPRMTLCAGKTAYRVRRRAGASCCIRLSQPLLSQRPHSDTVYTLLHEMIHAYLHVTEGTNYRDSHGPQFKSHMKRINSLEGSKITIFHNFRQEVDKFRTHVYKCDGPCVSKRPFFGILKRAIERPPGPTDKWWARHMVECGGTFRKIKGPGTETGIGSPSNRSTVANHNKTRLTHNSVNKAANVTITNRVKDLRLISRIAQRERDQSKFGKMAGSNSTGKLSGQFTQSKVNKDTKSQNFYESDIVRKIQNKYANVKRTVLLSKEDSEHLNNIQNSESSRMYKVPFKDYTKGKSKYKGSNKSASGNPSKNRFSNDRYIKGKSSFGNPSQVCAYVEGRVNYSYQPHSSGIIVAKYLKRFYEATVKLTSSSSMHDSFETLQNRRQSSATSFTSRENTLVNEKVKDEGVERTAFNYDYQSKTPEKIKLAKYISRYRAKENNSYSTENSVSSWGRDSRSVEATSMTTKLSFSQSPIMKNPLGNRDLFSQPGTSKTTMCPVCNKQIPSNDYERHLGECFVNDFDSDVDFFDDSSSSKSHSKGVSESQNDTKLPRNTNLPNRNKRKSRESSFDDSEVNDCPNCGSKVHVAEINLHLQYCVDSDSDTETRSKISEKVIKGIIESKTGKSLDVGLVSCPSCMKKVLEKNINQHLDECLKFFSEEF